MAVEIDDIPKVYPGNNSTTRFNYKWPLWDETHILVRLYTIATDTYEDLVVGVDYTVNGVGSASSADWYIDTTVAVPSTKKIVLEPNAPNYQLTRFGLRKNYDPARVEGAMDYLTVQIQALNAKIKRCVQVDAASDIDPAEYIDAIIEARNDSETAATNSANSATSSATSATNSANSATASANSATASANSATASANSATAAAGSATTASTQATNAANSASAASTSATNAATSATNSANSATASAGSATTAATQATNASNSASAAANSATNAAASASAAANSAASIKRVGLTANKTIYVSTTGNDTTGDGTSGNPWLTIQKAWDVLQKNYDLAGYVATISVAAGTYSAGLDVHGLITGQTKATDVVIIGNGSCNISITTPSCCFYASGGAMFSISGFTLSASASGKFGVFSEWWSEIFIISGMTFGSFAGGTHIAAANKGHVISANTSITVTGQAQYHVWSYASGLIYVITVSYTITGTPAISYFAIADRGGIVRFQSTTFSGSVTGQRYLCANNSIIDTFSSGSSYFPGSIAGASSNGGIYL